MGLAWPPAQGRANHMLPLARRGREEVWQTSGEGEAPDGLAPPPPGPGVTKAAGPGRVPPAISALTKAVQDVVKIVEIIVAVLHDGPVAHGVIEPAVRIRHCACTGRGDKGPEGTVTTQSVPSAEVKKIKQTEVRSRSTVLARRGFLPSSPAQVPGLRGPWLLSPIGRWWDPPGVSPFIRIHFVFLCCQLGLLPPSYPWWATLLGGGQGQSFLWVPPVWDSSLRSGMGQQGWGGEGPSSGFL